MKKEIEMKQVIIVEKRKEDVYEEDLIISTPIFAMKQGKLAGLLVREKDRWILRIGGPVGATGWYDTRKQCMQSCIGLGYTFFVEEE